ncbi:MAG: GH3 auxin-responsive promoter family protein [Nanoarchaeota archaeon]|nr:GH3 auxin-responsive promoter family protein [Nanoarchaeota archaeon]
MSPKTKTIINQNVIKFNKLFKKAINKINLNLNPYQLYLNFKFTKPFLKIHNNTQEIQKKTLFKIIEKNKNTNFGNKNNFINIKSIEDYKNNVAISKYENLKEYIEKSKNSYLKNNNELIKDKIHYYSITTGTTSYPKFIPHTKDYILFRKNAWNIWTNSIFQEKPETFSLGGSILTFTSKPYDGKLKSGAKFGSISGLLHEIQPKFIKYMYAYPNEILLIENFHIKYYLILLFSLKKKINIFVTPNPSTLIIYGKKFEEHYDELINDLENNHIEILEKDKNIDYNLKKKILSIYKKNKKR